jgi:hypothetical protein
MLLPHLAMLKSLDQTLGARALLELRQGHNEAAWTNLLASTQLAAAYDPEPSEISCLVRCACVEISHDIAWQMLQSRGWSDEQLADLQRKWQSFDLFKGLPETAAFARASAVDMCQREREQPTHVGLSPNIVWHSPRSVWPALVSYWRQMRYRHHGTYEDEKALLLFYRDRELQLQNAIQAKTWSEMRLLPGITNAVPFKSTYSSRLQVQLNMHQISRAAIGGRFGMLGRAAEAEARRRLVVTAIVLERYRIRHQSYPRELADLAPEFLKEAPLDFMDGKPLRYSPTTDGHFVLYSVGLDCSDNGGAMPQRRSRGFGYDEFVDYGAAGRQPTDLVWPRPATPAEVDAQKSENKRVKKEQIKRARLQEAELESEREAERRATVHKLLTISQPARPEPQYRGRPMSEILQKEQRGPKLTLDELLTLKQVVTGEEPNIATFNVPLGYDEVTNIANLHLVLDGEDHGECFRSTNGHCLLAWNTTFSAWGQHALQAELSYNEPGKALSERWHTYRGPVVPFFSSNLCQFKEFYSTYDPAYGATLYARLPELNGTYSIEVKSPSGKHVKTFTGTTRNSIIDVHCDLIDEHGQAYTNGSFDTVFDVTLPDSGRSQTIKGP